MKTSVVTVVRSDLLGRLCVCACVASDLQQRSLKELLKAWRLLITFQADVRTLEAAVGTSSA